MSREGEDELWSRVTGDDRKREEREKKGENLLAPLNMSFACFPSDFLTGKSSAIMPSKNNTPHVD